MNNWEADTVTLCGQKVHGPKGSGALLCKNGIDIHREGTPAVPLIVGFTRSLDLAQSKIQEQKMRIQEVRRFFLQTLDEQGVGYVCNGDREEASLVLNLSFLHDQRDSEQLIIACDQAGLELSSKSACMGSQASVSRLLEAIGEQRTNSIRISLHHELKIKDIQDIVKKFAQVLN